MSYQNPTYLSPSVSFLSRLVYLRNILERLGKSSQPLPPGSYKTSLDTSPPPILLSLHCKKINKVQNELDGQPSSLIALMHVSNYTATFSPMHLVFLEFDTHLPLLDFKLLNENNNEGTLRTFFLQLLIS